MDPLLHEFLGTSGNEYPTTNKTEDEIKRLTLEEDMPEVKRATHILYRGQAIQKPSVYTNLYKILLEPESFSKVLPYIAEGILSQSGEIQIEAGRSLMKLMKNHELEEEQLLDIFRITMTVTTLWNQAVLDTWVLVFHELLKQLPYNMISAHCESSIVNLSDQSQHPLSKYAAGRMIGFIADQNIKPTEPLFDRARFLCQDSEVEVRKIMAQEVILKICRHVGASLTENKYLEKILELTYDSDSEVKMAAIQSVVEALDILSFGFKRSKMVQVLMELANSTNEEVVKKMSFLIGKVIHKLEKIILGNPQLFSQIQNLVKEWASHKDLEIKKNVIYNIPYLIRIMGNKEFFKDIYIKATKDNNLEIRFIAMSSFHEVVKAYEVREAQIIFRETFESLFKEESIEILEKVVPHLAELLQVFQSTVEDETEDKEKDDSGKSKGKSKEIKEWKDWNGSTSDIDKSKESTKVCSKVSLDQRSCLEDLISIGTYLSFKHAWRLEIVFIENMNKCLDLFDLKELADVYVDYLIKGVPKSAKEVRRKLLETVVLYLAKNHYMAKTNEVMKKVVEEFANASTYQGRLAFLEFYEVCAGQFSRQFFKTYNMNELGLALGEDKVTEIKKKFLENAVLFKKMIGEEDKSSGAKLNEIISRNVKNSNKYIAQLASEKIKGLKFLTAAFFEEFDTENEERRQREEALQNKEKEEYETIKRRQQEVLLKERQDNFNALTSLLFGGRKGAKRTTWNDAYTIKLLKSTQSAAICLNETPKNKYIAPLVTLPALKTQKAPAIINSQSSQKELESKLNPAKLRRHVVTPLEPPVPKKKAGSFSVATKEKIQDLASLRVPVVDRERERRPSKERNLVSEPSAREVPEMKSNKFLPIKELKNKERKDGVRVPTIRKKNP